MTNSDVFKRLQLFADGGGDGGAGAAPGSEAAGGAATGDMAPVAGVQRPHRGRRSAPQPVPATSAPAAASEDAKQAEPPERRSYEDIRKEYEKEFGEEIQSTVSSRLKGLKADQARGKMAEALLARMAARQYGIKAGEDGKLDLDAVNSRLCEDDVGDRAIELGVSEDAARHIMEMETELNERRQADRHREEEQAQQRLAAQMDVCKQQYPEFDPAAEGQNPEFLRLVGAGVPVRDAYELIHRDEIRARERQAAIQQTSQAISASIQAGQGRPQEGGLGRQATSDTNRGAGRTFSRADLREIRRKTARGEKVYL